jgi:hypothetical protein
MRRADVALRTDGTCRTWLWLKTPMYASDLDPSKDRLRSSLTVATFVTMARLFGDVEYLGKTYRDAELIDGIWFFYDSFRSFVRFQMQWRVRPLTNPQPNRQHSGPRSLRN